MPGFLACGPAVKPEIELWLLANVGPGGRHLDLGHPVFSDEWWDGDRWKLVHHQGTPSIAICDPELEILFRLTWC